MHSNQDNLFQRGEGGGGGGGGRGRGEGRRGISKRLNMNLVICAYGFNCVVICLGVY